MKKIHSIPRHIAVGFLRGLSVVLILVAVIGVVAALSCLLFAVLLLLRKEWVQGLRYCIATMLIVACVYALPRIVRGIDDIILRLKAPLAA